MRIWSGVGIGVASAITIAACGSSGNDSGGSGGAAGSTAGAGGVGASAGNGGSAGASGGGAGADGGGGTSGTAGGGGGAGLADFDGGPFEKCFVGQYVNGPTTGAPNYDQFNPVIGSHCKGTNMQDIKGVQKVVFLGDSVTVGTPPTNLNTAAPYRAILAKELATLFNLTPPSAAWGGADFSGNVNPPESGDFKTCAKWGARTDDLMSSNTQVTDCIPADKRNLHYLVIITDGGNDVAAITKDGGGTAPAKTIDQLWADTKAYVQLMRDAVTWMKDPANVPGGVDVVFGNLYEFTDGTGDVNSCALAASAGLQAWTDLASQKAMVVYAEEQYMKIAVDTHSDMIFMLESFCGHGYKRNDPTSPCYRGPNQDLWFDLTCIHPDVIGHAALADLFYQTIKE